MVKKLLSPKNLCLSGVIAALYAVLTMFLPVLSYGPWQCRISEALTLLPIILPQSIPGLFVGCLVSNITSTVGAVDIIFGSLATLLAAVGTYLLRDKKWLAAACPVVANGLIVGGMIGIVSGIPMTSGAFWLIILQVAAGEAVAVYVLGFLLLSALKRVDLSAYKM